MFYVRFPLSLRNVEGHAQVDFSKTLGAINGVECITHFFAMSFPQSGAVFVKA